MTQTFVTMTLTEQGALNLAKIKQYPHEYRKAIRQAMYFSGKHLKKTASEKFREPKSGNVSFVRRGSRRFKHVASAAGEAPARLTGALDRSVDFKVDGASSLEFGAGNDEVRYARALELGYMPRNLQPRPFLEPTVRESLGVVSNHINREISTRINSL